MSGNFSTLLNNPFMGYAEHRLIMDEDGEVCDYVFLEVNETFSVLTGLKRVDIINRSIKEILPDAGNDLSDWISIYGKVAKGGEPAEFKQFSKPLNRWYRVYAYSEKPLHFTTLFLDITAETEQARMHSLTKANLHAILESSLEHIWAIDRQYEVLYLNSTFQHDFEHAFGVKLTEGSSILAGLPEDVLAEWKPIYDRGLAGEQFVFEKELIIREQQVFVEVSANPIYENGEVVGVSCFSRNITERKQAVNALQASTTRLNSILNNINDVVWSVGLPDYDILYLSPKAEQLYGYSPEAFYAEPDLWRRAIHPDDLHTLDETNSQLAEKGYAVRQARIIRADGRIAWILDKSTLIKDQDGNPVRIDGIASDITARKLLEAERDEAAFRLRQFSHHLPGVLYLYQLNPDGTHTFPFTSRDLEDVFGCTPEEAAENADHVFKAVHPLDIEQVKASVEKSAQTLSKWRSTFRVITPDKKVLWQEGAATPQKTPDGSIVWFGYTEDVSERKNAEIEVQRFKTIADKAVYGEAIADLDGKLIYINRFFATVHGYKPEELEGKSLNCLHSPEQLKQVNRLNEKLLEHGTFDPTLVWHKHKNGRAFPMLMSGVLIRDDFGSPQYLATTAIDITEQHNAEQSLLETQKQLTNISDNIPDGLVYQLISKPGYRRFTYLSAGVEKLHGLKASDALEEPSLIYGQMHPDDAKRLAEAEQQSIQNLSVFQCEYRIFHPDGSVRWLYASSTPKLQPDDSIIWDGIEIDITSRKKAEQEIVHLSQAVEQSPVSVIITDVAGNITYVNPSFERITGYSKREVLGKNPRILKSGHQPDSFYEGLWADISSGNTWKGELLNLTKNGVQYWESAIISPIKNELGEITHYLAVKENITAQKLANTRLRKSEQKYRIVADNTYHWEFWEAPNGELLYNSPACLSVSGYSTSDFKARPDLLTSIIHPDDKKEYLSHRSETWSDPKPSRCEFRLIHKDQSHRHIEHVCQPVFDQSGKFLGVRGTNIDVTERKAIESKLVESEQRFREIFEKIPVISVQGYNREREVIYWNEASEKLYGYSRSEALGQKLDNLIIRDEDKESMISAIDKWIQTGEPIASAELILKRKDGNLVHVYSNHVLIRNLKGEPELYCIDIDLSELKQKENELRLSEQRYRSVIRVSNTGAWEYNFRENKLWCSPEYFTMLGYTPLPFSDKAYSLETWIQLIHPDDRERAKAVFLDYLNSGMNQMYENHFRMLHKDGRSVWIWSRGQNLPATGSGSSDVVLGVHIDITVIREAEEKLRQSELYHRSLLQTIPDLVIVIDRNGFISDYKAPPEFELHIPEEYIIGSNVRDILPASVAENQLETIRKAFKQGGVHSFEYELETGGRKQFFGAFTTAFGKDRAITSVRNITDYKEKIQEVETLLELEGKQSQSLRSFTHIVSHNLRIHSANMLGIFMMLELDEPELYQLQYLQMLKESAENLEETIANLNQVLDFKSKNNQPWVPADLHELVKKVFMSVSQLAANDNVRLINDIPPGTVISTIHAYMNTILLNLITNSIKFSSDQRASYVRVYSQISEKTISIAVEDNGTGIDLQRHKDKLFGMYKKFHNDRGSKGLGLFIIKNQIEAMGGTISVQSEPNKGSTFTIIMPYGKD